MLPSETLLRLVDSLHNGSPARSEHEMGVRVVLEKVSEGEAALFNAQVSFRGRPTTRTTACSEQAAQALREAFALLRASRVATCADRNA